MELIHHCERDISNRNKQNISLENLASKQKLSGFLKSTRRAQGDAHQTEIVGGAGGASRDRTGDLLVANQALSQLSYGPCTSPREVWWVWEELHPRPHPYQGCALTN